MLALRDQRIDHEMLAHIWTWNLASANGLFSSRYKSNSVYLAVVFYRKSSTTANGGRISEGVWWTQVLGTICTPTSCRLPPGGRLQGGLGGGEERHDASLQCMNATCKPLQSAYPPASGLTAPQCRWGEGDGTRDRIEGVIENDGRTITASLHAVHAQPRVFLSALSRLDCGEGLDR